MNVQNRIKTLVVLGAIAVAGIAQAQREPVVDIEGHGNLRAAQEHIQQAFELIGDAQQANDARLGGHAGRARQLLMQANDELRQAAEYAEDR